MFSLSFHKPPLVAPESVPKVGLKLSATFKPHTPLKKHPYGLLPTQLAGSAPVRRQLCKGM